MPLLIVAAFVRYVVLNENYRLEAAGWAYLSIFAVALVLSGVRIFRLEAWPREPGIVVTRTRELGPVTELVIAGAGAFLLFIGLLAVILSGTTEMWGGVASERSISAFEVAMMVFTLGLPGFFMVYWRPMFVIDAAAGTIRRYPFGRALGAARTFPAERLRIVSDGYWTPNQSQRTGDIVRGKLGKYTFELELIPGNVDKEYVARRVAWWARAFDVRSARDGRERT